MRVTVQQLIDKGACVEQVELVAAMWGSRPIEVNTETCTEAAALGLDVNWAAGNLLPKSLYDAYWAQRKSIYDSYQAQRKLLDDLYWAQRKPLDDAYEAQRKPLTDVYEAQCKTLTDAYQAQRKPLDDAYCVRYWQLFANIVMKDRRFNEDTH